MSIKLKDIQNAIDKSYEQYNLSMTQSDKEHWDSEIKKYESMYQEQKSIVTMKLIKKLEGLK